MHLPISISCDRGRGKKTVETKALVDSSAGGTFIDQNFARTKGFRLQNLEHPITVYTSGSHVHVSFWVVTHHI